MKKKDLIFPGISALFLIFAGFSALFFNKPNVETNADADVQTDMSSVALLSNESIDTSKIIYDDFSGTSLDKNWVISHRKWGGYDNKGVSSKNVYLDTANDKVLIRCIGNQNLDTSTIDGVGGPVSGGCLVLKDAARPGRYEARFKAAYNVGVCNAFWTYTENNLGQNHEIDIEFPFKDDYGNNSFDEVIFTNYIGESNFQQTHKKLNFYLNDGEYHTYAFDWYYSNNHKEIRYYIDSQLLATHKVLDQLPFMPSRLWLGCWLPNNPGFVGIPNFDECFMEIDYFKYSPFKNQASQTQGAAGGCGNTSTDYNIGANLFPKYDWLSNGSFHSINKSSSMQDRGYETTGTVRLYNGYDHEGKANSGGLKMNANSSIKYHIDSTYKDYKYNYSTYYKGEGKASFTFYSKNGSFIKTVSVTLPYRDNWGKVNYPFEVPTGTFYTEYKVEATTNELYLDDMSVVFSDGTQPPEEIVLMSISLIGPNKTTYTVNDSLDLTGLIVTGTYSDGSQKQITDYQVSDVDLSTPGTKTVVITVGDQSASFQINVDEEGHSSATLTGITVEGEFKTEYLVGEQLDFTGMVVKTSYSDGTSKAITDYEIYKPSTATPGQKRVTVTYIDQTAYFNITVSKVPEEEPEDTDEPESKALCGGNIAATGAILLGSGTLGVFAFVMRRKFF